jgi:hypothetical protein
MNMMFIAPFGNNAIPDREKITRNVRNNEEASMRSTVLFLSLFAIGCGSVFNGSTVSYKAPGLEPTHQVDARGRGHCSIGRTGTEMTVALHGTPDDVASGFNTMNGRTFTNAGIYLYECELAAIAGNSVGGGSDDEALATATETKNAFEDYLVEKAKDGGGGQPSASAAAQQQPIQSVPATQPAPVAAPTTSVPQTTPAPAPAPAPAQTSATAPSPAPVANLCQGIDGAASFSELAGVYERTAGATADIATRAAYYAKVRILRTQAEKPQDQQLFQTVRNAMSIEDACK